MLFNSFDFLCFLPIVTILFFLLPHQFRTYFLLVASCIFYCYFIPIYLLLLVFIILVDYFAAINIDKNTAYKKYWLLGSIAVNVSILIIFKYYNFFVSNFNEQFGMSLSLLKIILPIGLSFHTFQAMAYTIEVYRGTIHAEKRIENYALYVLFFPQLVAGPIERPLNILPQLHVQQKFTSQNLLNGLRLIAWGFFKKLVIADRLSLIVDLVYKEPQSYKWYIVMATIFFFSIQIYCDFSGYTDIARGSAKIMGYDLMINFNRPLLSKSIRQFWQRWHISLSTWFRDYIYIPLGGNRDGYYKKFAYIFLVFILSGIWHGAGWNFVIWGAIHAFFLTLSLVIVQASKRIHTSFSINFLQILAVNFIVAYAFIFFRNNSLQKAKDIITSSLHFKPTIKTMLITQFPGIGNFTIVFLLLFIFFMFYYEEKVLPNLSKMNNYTFWDTIWFVCIFICIIFFGIFTKESFIYFQF
jgi:alginate O-acetyltransferase complex protein AlgI